jgi:hypothetical protein
MTNVNLTLDNFNLDFNAKLEPIITNDFNFVLIACQLDDIIKQYCLSMEIVDNSEPYENITDMQKDWFCRYTLKISNLYHPNYVHESINLKLRLVHDWCHIQAYRLFKDFCPNEFNTISELLAYQIFEDYFWKYPDLIKYNRFDFVAQTIYYHKFDKFMYNQILFNTDNCINPTTKIFFSI